jgi:ligand-binding sensor domain-containing protein
VRAIAVDGTGALWFGTAGGVSRYETKTGAWTTFNQKDGLASNDVRAIAVDGTGALWFGTAGGVSRYETKTGAWTTFNQKDGLASNDVRAIAVDGTGAPWFGTAGGVSRYETKTGAWTTFNQKDGLANNNVQTVAVDALGALWFGTRGGGVSRYETKTGAWTTFNQKDGLASNDVRAIAVDPLGALWFGTRGSGVSRYETKTGAWTTFNQKDGLASDDVQAIAVDPLGALWFGTRGGGVSRYETKTGAWTTFNQKDGLASNDVRAIAVDGTGAPWFGTHGGGVSRYETKTGAWTTFNQKDGLASDDVQAIAVDGTGALWFGTHGGGVSRYETKTGAWTTFNLKDGLASDDVRAIAVDALGALWFGAYGGGVNRYETKTGVWTTVNPRDDLTLMQAIVADTLGALWFGTIRGGVSRYETKTGVWTTVDPNYGITYSQAIAVDALGALWSGTPGNGVTRLVLLTTTEAGTTFTTTTSPRISRIAVGPEGIIILARPAGLSYSRPPAEPIPLRSFPAGADAELLARGPDGAVWVGTSGAGLVLRKPGQDLQLTTDGGLPSMTVISFSPTAQVGMSTQLDSTRIWVGTSAGAALVHSDGQALHVERNLVWEGMPTGPVDALVAVGDGSVFVAYNQLPARRFLDPALAARRSRTHVFRVSPDNTSHEIATSPRFAKSQIHALAYSDKHGLWAATSAGLFGVTKKSGGANLDPAGFQPVTGEGRLAPAPIRNLAVAPDQDHTLWMSTDKQGDTPPFIIGFRPDTGWAYYLTEDRGVPKGDVIDDLTFTDDGELVVLVGSKLAKGHVFVPVTPSRTPLWVWALVALGLVGASAGGTALALRRNSLPARIRKRPVGLPIGEPELKALLFAKSPERTFAGLLHTRGVLAVSPYDTSGAVKEEPMFFGRAALLRELLLASSVQQIVIGPRRVGKTSLLKSLQRDLPARRPDVDIVFLDLLGIKDPQKAARNLARQLDTPVPADADPDTALADLLQVHFQRTTRKTILLIDEADGLVQTDAAKGRFVWAIPLLRETLLAAEPELAARRLVEELTELG